MRYKIHTVHSSSQSDPCKLIFVRLAQSGKAIVLRAIFGERSLSNGYSKKAILINRESNFKIIQKILYKNRALTRLSYLSSLLFRLGQEQMGIFFVSYFSRQAIQLYRHSLSEHDEQKWYQVFTLSVSSQEEFFNFPKFQIFEKYP